MFSAFGKNEIYEMIRHHGDIDWIDPLHLFVVFFCIWMFPKMVVPPNHEFS